ncbi:MAG: hypothetical protein ABSE06_22025 [Anaerolineaceae bacterium]
MTDTPPAVSPRRRRGAPLRNLNALKHRISRKRPENTARPTSKTWPIASLPASRKK